MPFSAAAWMAVVLRAYGEQRARVGPLRAELQRLDPDRALANVATLDERIQLPAP